MTMAISDWTNLNPRARVIATKKKLYKKYFYKLKYNCPFGRCILSADDHKLDNLIAMRMALIGDQEWAFVRNRVDQVDKEQINTFYEVYKKLRSQIFVRVEEPFVTFYTTNESVLKELATEFSKWHDRIIEIMLPDKKNLKVLEDDCIFVGPNIDFKFKIVLKSGVYQNKQSVADYLNNLKDRLQISKACRAQLETSASTAYGIWFYTNEDNLGFMLNLIEPNVVTSIHRLIKSKI